MVLAMTHKPFNPSLRHREKEASHPTNFYPLSVFETLSHLFRFESDANHNKWRQSSEPIIA